ncbi:hypothetical protein FisN_6Lh245 [Fistulifera solaris]|uniref:CCR4-NOT transcription complex subunit 11 n=1 Tax=Fistulifera solaris TaxID=1519565 RepID=A0A1Z5J6I4_FISSO|nr:hypothetical protein FisN_6Lh245 [Fistulifera solaris]|eukprot:GAX09381.1 hypothetical protein FisN_6Lh245 [Fistulifera solaris]
MTEIEPFWRQYWDAVDHSPQTFSALRHCAMEAIRPHDSLFLITWAAHVLLSTNTTISTKQKLGCLAVLEACCQPKRRESPFFRMLLIDALELLQQLVNDSKIVVVEDEWVISSLYELIESFLPEILGPEQFAALQTAVQQKAVTEEIRRLLDEALQAYIISRDTDSYVSPLLLFPPEQNKAAELAKLLSTEESKEESHETPSVRATDLLQPFKSLEIPFARPLPPPLPPVCGYEAIYHDEEKLHAELIWITPSNLRLMLLPLDDTHDAGRESRFQQVLDLMLNKAFLKPLAPNEQRLIMEVLHEDGTTKKDPFVDSERLVRECGLNPQNLHRLVENNPMVAHECLLRILRPSSDYSEDDKNEYLSSLVSMDMSLHTMEVVNRLATYANNHPGSPNLLHPEYIHLFIGSCIASCENIPDQHAQNRLVRLVCVFVQSLLRNQIVQVEDIYVVMESFCIEFSRIREAAALFKMLRSSGG